MMPIERLSADDRIMLWGDEVWPQEVGALAVLDGSGLLDPDGRFKVEVVRAAVEDRLHLVPRFRQLLYAPRRGLGGPLWVDDPAFDLRDHVQVVPLPAPADEAQLLLATEGLRRRRLDRSRPLWGMWFLPGLAGDRIGLFVKMHHVIGDGIAGVATLGTLLDTAPEATAAQGRSWAPAPLPPARALLAENLGRHVEGLGRGFWRLARSGTALEHVRAAWPAMRELFAEEPPAETSLDHMVGPDRNLALIRSRLELVKDVAHDHDAKVNDVLLAAAAGGLCRLLRDRGERVDDITVRIAVPVSLRQGQAGAAGGNLVGEMVVPLPIGLSDPSRRLRQIAASTAKRKAKTPASVGTLLRSRVARRLMVKALDRQRLNVTSADVPGPPSPLYLAGARVLEVFPVLPLIWKVSLGIGAMSYAGQFNIMAVADRAACPDIDVFAAGMTEELDALRTRSSREPIVSSERS
jgi:diacylglycerol O-acyltransferase / wax synthase